MFNQSKSQREEIPTKNINIKMGATLRDAPANPIDSKNLSQISTNPNSALAFKPDIEKAWGKEITLRDLRKQRENKHPNKTNEAMPSKISDPKIGKKLVVGNLLTKTENGKESKAFGRQPLQVSEYFRNIIDERLSGHERKPTVYAYQKELINYLRELDSQFMLKKSDRRTSDAFKTGLEFLDGALNKPDFKPKTRLLAVYMWHSLFGHSEDKLSDKLLLQYLPACLFIASKHEEYYMTGSKHVVSWHNIHFSRSSCLKFGMQEISKKDLFESEMGLLELFKFKIVTPNFMNQISLLRAELLHEHSTKFDISACKVLEEAYTIPGIFCFPGTELALACLALACSNLDEMKVWQKASSVLSQLDISKQKSVRSRDNSLTRTLASKDKLAGTTTDQNSSLPKGAQPPTDLQTAVLKIDMKTVQKIIEMLSHHSEKRRKDRARLVAERFLPQGISFERGPSSQRH